MAKILFLRDPGDRPLAHTNWPIVTGDGGSDSFRETLVHRLVPAKWASRPGTTRAAKGPGTSSGWAFPVNLTAISTSSGAPSSSYPDGTSTKERGVVSATAPKLLG